MSDEETLENIEEFHLSAEAIEKMRDPESIKAYFEEGKTFQDLLGYTEESMEKLYKAAYGLFQQRKYRECTDAFTFLTTVNPFIHNYWLGLGMSEQMIEDYEAALIAYAMATMTNLKSPVAHYHSASCYWLLGDTSSALTALDLAVERAEAEEQYADYLQAAEALRTKMKNSKR